MYKSGYVAALKCNGNIIEEDSSKRMFLPFGSEYEVRLINKNNTNCKADLTINGEIVGSFFINAGATADIERYLDGSNYKGKKFKFTHLNDTGVKDKNDIDNGFIEVSFYPEKPKPDPIVIKEHHYHYDTIPNKPYGPKPMWYGTEFTNDMSFGGSVGMAANYCSSDMKVASSSPAIEGATVRGSDSDQKFETVHNKEFEAVATTMRLKIFNGEIKVANKYCSGCGKKNTYGHKFCPSCGKGIQ